MRVLVTGASGQLGRDVMDVLVPRYEVIGIGRKEADLEDTHALEALLHRASPDCIIHCAAYTKVDQAESERERCARINVDATAAIARVAQEIGASLLYFSTDYVFDGRKEGPYETSDTPEPINHYGLTKLLGERAVSDLVKEHFIVRTSWVFGRNGHNFVNAILRKAAGAGHVQVVADQVGSPTYTRDLAELIAGMVSTREFGLYHATNEGFCSWYEFALEILSRAGRETEVEAISSEHYASKAARPKNSRLSKSSLDEHGFPRLPDWRDALQRYLGEIGALAVARGEDS
jgi:dTDP-4-dehydrorhamnose reductase